jgi:hypothetical protein
MSIMQIPIYCGLIYEAILEDFAKKTKYQPIADT